MNFTLFSQKLKIYYNIYKNNSARDLECSPIINNIIVLISIQVEHPWDLIQTNLCILLNIF